jgi:phage terminase large subunit-like protein
MPISFARSQKSKVSGEWLARELHDVESADAPLEPLLDYIPRVSPQLVRPVWMARYCELLDRATHGPIRAVVAGPPQHTKTECSVHAIIKAVQEQPTRRHGYATYGQTRADRVEARARRIAQGLGIELIYRKGFWFNPETGGSVVWTSRSGGLPGEPIDGLLILDDLIKDRREAESATVLGACADFLDDVALPRCHATASVIVIATRWSKRDPSGVLIARGWSYLNMQALADGPANDNGEVIDDPNGRKLGEALWPERRTAAQLRELQRVNPFSFASLYQGAPRPRGGTVFEPASYYDELPKQAYRVGYGVDLAYSKKKTADYSVSLELWRYDHPSIDGKKQLPIYYVVNVERKQVRAPEFVLTLHSQQRKRRGPMRWYAAGTEIGAGDFIKSKIPELRIKPASEDKWQRAQPVAEAWNDGRVLVPSRKALGLDPEDMTERGPEWVDAFIDEVEAFTGVGGVEVDDQVDALAAGHDELERAGKSSDGGGEGGPPKQRSDLGGGGF